MSEGFFEAKREWSRWKHRLLKRYLGQFSGIVGSKHRTIYFIDGFAGKGRYNDPPEDGSPVIAAKLAADSASRQRNYSLRCINIEPENFDDLCSSTADFDATLVENRQGTFADNLDAVLKAIGTHPALFFLDPFGHKGMEWEVVQRVANRSRHAITEVLVTFYVTKIELHAGYLASAEKQAPKFVANLDALFGTSDWQEIYQQASNKEGRIQGLTNLYMDRLSSAFARNANQGIASQYAVKTIDGALKYFLIHGTAHSRGGRAMSESVFRVAMEYDGARIAAEQAARDATGQAFLFETPRPPSAEEIDESIVKELIPAVLSLRPRLRSFRLPDLEDALLIDWFGRAVAKHFRKACQRLVDQGKARASSSTRDQTSPRKRASTIDNDTLIELI